MGLGQPSLLMNNEEAKRLDGSTGHLTLDLKAKEEQQLLRIEINHRPHQNFRKRNFIEQNR